MLIFVSGRGMGGPTTLRGPISKEAAARAPHEFKEKSSVRRRTALTRPPNYYWH
jgi:hypothetical protein